MALQKPWANDQNGLSASQAYHRILAVLIDTQEPHTEIVVGVYLDKAARQSGKQPVDHRSFGVRNHPADPVANLPARSENDTYFGLATLDAAGANPVKQAYLWLRTHALYQDAVDV